MTLILLIFIDMKYLITFLLFFIGSLSYSQAIYDPSEFYETVKVKYDTLYKENGTIRQIGKVSYNLQGEKHGEWLIWDNNSKLRAKMFYENGIRKGKWEVYDEHGNLISSKNYSKSN